MERLHAHVGAGRKFTDLQARFRLHLPRKTSQAQVAGKTGCFACALFTMTRIRTADQRRAARLQPAASPVRCA
jgi:hypothetical protein